MGNSFVKNLRVSVGLPSVTEAITINRQWLIIIQGYEQYFDHSEIIFVSPELSSVRDYVITHSVRSM